VSRNIFKFWLPVFIWMAVIFSASSDSFSSQHTSRILGPLLHWLFPKMSEASIAEAVFEIRKTAHAAEYALLALLIWRALRKPFKGDMRPWSWAQARLVLLLSACYAASDEFHQLFVPTREARVHDVAIDTTGAAAALLLLWWLGRWRKMW
jgi:VanZ family protein